MSKRMFLLLIALLALTACSGGSSGGVPRAAQQEAIDDAIDLAENLWNSWENTVEIQSTDFSVIGALEYATYKKCFRVDVNALVNGTPARTAYYGTAGKNNSFKNGWAVFTSSEGLPLPGCK